MSSIWGKNIKISIFGESHGPKVGVTIDGLPAGEFIDINEINFQMKRRAPGICSLSTARVENDIPDIISGIMDSYTTGAPITANIENKNANSEAYKNNKFLPRPGHADYTSLIRYKGFADLRGGGHLSGRLTAPLTFAGSICRQFLAKREINIAAHILSIKNIKDLPFNLKNLNSKLIQRLNHEMFAVISSNKKNEMQDLIANVKKLGDSLGGVVECAVCGVPAGIGSPIFEGVENVISSLLFCIGGVRGVEFGAGFDATNMYGSEHNDQFTIHNGNVLTETNNHGGVLGGITTGMPIIFRAAIKPTPSISKMQKTVNLETMQNETITVGGQHDPCIVPRAVVVIEAVAAIAITEILLGKI